MDDHGNGVTNESHVDAGSVDLDSGRVVVSGDHGDGLIGEVLLAEGAEGDALVRALGFGTAIDGALSGDVAEERPGETMHGAGDLMAITRRDEWRIRMVHMLQLTLINIIYIYKILF